MTNKVKPPFDSWHMYCAGQRVRKHYKEHSSWIELINSDEWDFCVQRFKLNKENIAHFKDGYKGDPYRNPKVTYFTTQAGDTIVPFGRYKDQYISKVPMQEIVRWSEQPWIIKWPTVLNWIKQNEDKINAHKSGYSEGIDELKTLGEVLKGNY